MDSEALERDTKPVLVALDGGISSGIAYAFYYKGLQRSSLIIAGVMTLLGPVVGGTLSILLLRETFTVVQVAGMAGLLATVCLSATSSLRSVG